MTLQLIQLQNRQKPVKFLKRCFVHIRFKDSSIGRSAVTISTYIYCIKSNLIFGVIKKFFNDSRSTFFLLLRIYYKL